MTDVVYRVPGFMSPRSVQYTEALVAAGWPDYAVENLKNDLPRFESYSLYYSFEDCLKGLVYRHDEAHYPFLEELCEHIKMVAAGERLEELQRKAKTNDKDSMAAQQLWAQLHPGYVVNENGEAAPQKKSAEIHFHVKEAKTDIQVTRGKRKAAG